MSAVLVARTRTPATRHGAPEHNDSVPTDLATSSNSTGRQLLRALASQLESSRSHFHSHGDPRFSIPRACSASVSRERTPRTTRSSTRRTVKLGHSPTSFRSNTVRACRPLPPEVFRYGRAGLSYRTDTLHFRFKYPSRRRFAGRPSARICFSRIGSIPIEQLE